MNNRINIFYFTLLFFCTNCAATIAQTGGHFNLTGSISNTTGTEDSIDFTYFNADGDRVTEVLPTIKGNFQFSGETIQPNWARFYSHKSKANGGFVLDTGNLKLNLSNKLPYLKSVENSNTHNENIAYSKTFRPDLKLKSDSVYALVKALRLVKDTFTNQDNYQKIYQNYFAVIGEIDEEKQLDYIKLNPNSKLSIVLARGLYNHDPKIEKLDYLFSLLSAKSKETFFGKQLEDYIYKTKNVSIDRKLPDFTLPDTMNKFISLNQFKGKHVLVDFWYSGCPPCIAQFPKLREIRAHHGDKFEIVGVSHDGDRDRSKWLKVLNRIPTNWVQLLDSKNEICERFGIEAFPSNFLLNKEGIIVAKNVSEEELESYLVKNK
jgi:peroxiredoxin